jgi:hypothetical protein
MKPKNMTNEDNEDKKAKDFVRKFNRDNADYLREIASERPKAAGRKKPSEKA